MRIKELNEIIKNNYLLNSKVEKYKKLRIIKKQKRDTNEIYGHIEKAEHNLEFIKDNLKLGYFDWCITGCYYAVYHMALSLILARGFSSKNHDATLSLLIKEYYKEGISEEDIELINKFFLDYQDLLFYIDSKRKRENATYSTTHKFDKKDVENLRLKTISFVNKTKGVLKNEE